ncbi:MAG: alpha/beta hydrolase [Beutenbergiaceae bacterium]
MHWSEPEPDVLPGWVHRTLLLGTDKDAVATLVHRSDAGNQSRAMLHLHGYVDYFFHTHHADVWAEQGYDVYAVELRDYGRSIRPGRVPNWIADLGDYHTEIDAALSFLKAQGYQKIVLNGHSTGALIASLWAHEHPGEVDALVLNSPWFDLNASWFDRVISTRLIDWLGSLRPHQVVAQLGEAYGRSIHRSTGGEWDYNLDWKPLAGFGIEAGWLRAIRRGHARLASGLAITIPVLVATSGRTGDRKKPSALELADADCVLNVKQMWARAPLLGPRVRIIKVPGARHDLTLSQPRIRQIYDHLLFDWLERILP